MISSLYQASNWAKIKPGCARAHHVDKRPPPNQGSRTKKWRETESDDILSEPEPSYVQNPHNPLDDFHT